MNGLKESLDLVKMNEIPNYKKHVITPNEIWYLGDYNIENHPDFLAESLQKYLEQGEYIEITMFKKASVKDLEEVVKKLRQERLNIGKNSEQFKYDIWPEEENTKKPRTLSIYRREK